MPIYSSKAPTTCVPNFMAQRNRVQGNQLFSVTHDLYYLSKSGGNVDQDKLYSDQVKSKINSYEEGENRPDDIYSKFDIIDIKGCFSDSDVKDFYTEAEAYDKEVITIRSTQVFADEAKLYVKVKDSDDDVMIGRRYCSFQRACFGSSSPVTSAPMKAWLSRKPRDEGELFFAIAPISGGCAARNVRRDGMA
ncbi:hypothetical protein AVEN_65885-1 [Araneus ventricosus]|uniref:Uncharacterized protein n=1 Tax=Araneus ventricosus TaxID=182803 RepID=A0A4Y2HEA4_ARAVE|nr:hypothetical protein AVEN_65885-1 [Araneus ventricosus]